MKKNLLFPILIMGYCVNAQQVDTASSAINDTVENHSGLIKSKIISSFPLIADRPEYNFSKLLDGLVTGLQTTNGSGQPGSSSDMLIRGMSSLSSNNTPFIILDGIPYYGDFSSINVNDIYSITVLKDAVSTFEFGNKSGNGIISIVTKQKSNDNSITPRRHLDVNAQFGTSMQELSDYKTLNTKEYLETLNGALQNAGSPVNIVDYLGGYNPYNVPKDQLIGSDGKLTPNAQLRYNDNWEKEMKRAGIRQSYNVAASGNGNKGMYYLSTNYVNDKGYVKQTDYERFSVRFNGEYNVTKWFTIGLRSQAAFSSSNLIDQGDNSNVFETSQLIAPVYPVYYRNSNGDKEKDPLIGGNKFDWGNTSLYPNSSIGNRRYLPGLNSIASLFLDDNKSSINMFLLNPYLTLKLPEGFSYSANLSYNYNKSDYNQNYNGIYGSYATTGGAKGATNNKLNTLYFRQKLEWDKTFSGHEFTWSLGNDYNKQNTKEHSEFTYGNNYTYNSVGELSHNLSYYTQLKYNYKGKYLVFAGIRTDQTFDYPLPSGWRNGWALGANYVISEESFFRDIKWLDLMKVKVNYGTQDRYFSSYNQAMPFQLVPPPSLGMGIGQAVTPSSGNQLSAGIEATLFHNILSFDINFYNRNSGENIEIPVLNQTNNPFKYNNKGLEFVAYTTNMSRKNFSWNSSFRLTHNTNKITQLPESMQYLISGLSIYKVGSSMASFSMPEYAGVDANTGAALYYKNDAGGNRITTKDYASVANSDFKNFGSSFPKVYGSITNSFTLRNFECSFQINYSIGGLYYDKIYQALMSDGSQGTNWSKDILNQWLPTNRNTIVPKLNMGDVNEYNVSSRFLKSASYLSFANLYAGYKFNDVKISKLKMQSLRLYVSANNLYMIAGRKGMNPQADFNNNPGYVYGPSRNIIMGVKIGI